MKPRVVFMGTPAFAVPALRAVAAACDVVRVVTQPDRPSGRGLDARASAVADAAGELGLPVLRAGDLKAQPALDTLADARADVFAVVAFGVILSRAVLALPRAGCVNLHGSLLPDYRGASPVQSALWDGRGETGVCTLFMDEGIDTGDVIACRSEPIREDDDAGSLASRLAERGAPLLAESVLLAAEGRAPRTPQDRAAGSYARKLKKEDGVVDWSRPAGQIHDVIRGLHPWPHAYTFMDGTRLILLRSSPSLEVTGEVPGTVIRAHGDDLSVAAGGGVVRIRELQLEGKRPMATLHFLAGHHVTVGARLSPKP